MKKIYKIQISIFLTFMMGLSLFAGNPDRQGEAGAYELLMNPWARSAGLHSLSTSFVSGVDAMRINPAGISRINKTQVVISNAQYLVPSDIQMNAVGITQRVGESGAIGISLMALDFGDIPVTTVNEPEGTGATFSPGFFNLGVSYAHTFSNKISVGVLLRGISESISDLSAFGFSMDAGVQYVTGENDNFKFGIALRNVGSKMTFGGEGLADVAENGEDRTLRYDVQAASFDLPSLLHIGLSYDFLISEKIRLTALGNFTANSYSRDEIGGGLEFAFNEMFMLRAAYKTDLGISPGDVGVGAYSGLSAGLSVEVPVKKGSSNKFGIDYSYRATDPFNGTHNFGIRVDL